MVTVNGRYGNGEESAMIPRKEQLTVYWTKRFWIKSMFIFLRATGGNMRFPLNMKRGNTMYINYPIS